MNNRTVMTFAVLGAVLLVALLVGWMIGFQTGKTAARPLLDFNNPENEAAANRVKSASNLRQIGLSLAFYARDHGGVGPSDLNPLLNSEYPPDSLDCPIEGLHYVYLGYRRSDPEKTTIVAYEAPIEGQKTVNVLYADGRVDAVPAGKAIEQLKGQPHPKTE